jgi:hypothetical protein
LDKRRKRQRLIHKTLHNKLEERYRKNAVKSCTSEVYEEIRVLICWLSLLLGTANCPLCARTMVLSKHLFSSRICFFPHIANVHTFRKSCTPSWETMSYFSTSVSYVVSKRTTRILFTAHGLITGLSYISSQNIWKTNTFISFCDHLRWRPKTR